MKKIITLIAICFVLFVGFLPTSKVCAANLSESIVLRLTEEHTDNKIDIDVNLITNTGITGMTLELSYDKDVFSFDGFEEGVKLGDMDLVSSGEKVDSQRGEAFNWMSQNVENVFTTGKILRLHFTLKDGVTAGKYEIGFKNGKEGDVTYVLNNNPVSKTAITSKAVVNVGENGISEIEIKNDEQDNNASDGALPWIIGGAVLALGGGTAVTVILIKRAKKNRRSKNWVKL